MQIVLKVNLVSKKPKVVSEAGRGICGCSCMKCREVVLFSAVIFFYLAGSFISVDCFPHICVNAAL